MCGIVGYVGKENAIPVLIDGLKSLEYRGYDSAGLAVLNNNKIDIIKDSGRVSNLENLVNSSSLSFSNIGIAHTRWATHGKPSKENAHPHTDNLGEIAVVHNGIIENYLEMKTKLLNNGYFLHSSTDTEVIPNLIRLNYNGDLLKAVSDTVKELQGSFAIEVISSMNPDNIIVAKKDSPLVIGIGDNCKYIASDIPAIINKTNSVYFMEDGEIAQISFDDICFYDFNLNKLDKTHQKLNIASQSTEKGDFEDYMLKEIYEQPTSILETIGNRLSENIDLPLDEIDFSKFNKIYIVACGTAMHAGLASKYVFEHFCKLPVFVDVASEFRYNSPLIDDKTLCIFISQSGETADTIAAIKLAKKCNSTTLAIVNVIGSSMTREADYCIYTHAGPEIAVASTKAYTSQIVLLIILAMYIADNINSVDKKEIEELKKEILELPNNVTQVLYLDSQIKELATEYYNKKDIFFIGRGIDYTVAMEGSLKLKEISYIHSEAYTAGELKHGPIALIENGVPVIGIATNVVTSPKTVSNLEEVIAREADVILITNTDYNVSSINHLIKLPSCSNYVSPILSIIPMQLFAYHIAKAKNLDVDKPRNLAKSVTVE